MSNDRRADEAEVTPSPGGTVMRGDGKAIQVTEGAAAEPPRPTEEEIRTTAYLLWEQDGSPEGRDEYYWRAAIEMLGGGRQVPQVRESAEEEPSGA